MHISRWFIFLMGLAFGLVLSAGGFVLAAFAAGVR